MQDQAAARAEDVRPDGRSDGLTEAQAAKQRLLKAIVIGLGVLILLAFAGVAAGMVHRASQIGKPLSTGGASPGAASAGFKSSGWPAPALLSPPLQPDVKLPLPQGSVVIQSGLVALSTPCYPC